MNQQEWRSPDRPSGKAAGSVKRARERMEAGLPPEVPRPVQQPLYYEEQSQPRPMQPVVQQQRQRPQLPPGMTARNGGQGPIGVAISRPTQVPQWPLQATVEGGRDPRSNPQYQPPQGRGAAPQRPPRPSRVPSMLDSSKLQEPTPSFQYKVQVPPQPQQPNQRQYQQSNQQPSQQSNQRQNQQQNQQPQAQWSQQLQPSQPTRMYEDDGEPSPGIVSPISQNSRPSTFSSVGSIPDFPVPMPMPVQQPAALNLSAPSQGPPRRSANLGPPPSARRGNSSYYSTASFVSPIPEESPRGPLSHDSYASSAAMPKSWGTASPGFRLEDDDEEDYSDAEVFEAEQRGEKADLEERGESRESNGDDNDDQGLIRSASVGRRGKPSMITTKSSDKLESLKADSQRSYPKPPQILKLEKMGIIASNGGVAEASRKATEAAKSKEGARNTVWPIVGDPNSPLATGTGLIDETPSSEEESPPIVSPGVAKALTTNEPVASYFSPQRSTRPEAIMEAYNAASSMEPKINDMASPTMSPGFSRLSAVRRPPRLDMDAVRDAEARGSLTSLPDLIRRATKLAAMMERGKRPGSRLALNDFGSESDFRDKEPTSSEDEKHKSGFSGMLAAFPPPGAVGSRGTTPQNHISAWPDTYDPHALDFKPPRTAPRRKCCGLPVWGFLMVLFLGLVIIAAAVVVPLEFFVIHKTSKTSAATAQSAIQQCESDPATACQNGGTSFLDNGNCACICTNGLTGSTCTVSNFTGCSNMTSTVNGTEQNVTLGNAIPRLISGALNFSVPLNANLIIARFNNGNLTCASENALVTFDGSDTIQGGEGDLVSPKTASSSVTASPSTSTIVAQGRRKRSAQTTTTSSASAGSTNGIIYDPSPAPAPAVTSTSTSSPAAPTSTSNSNPSSPFAVTEATLDFARIVVLFVLQQENLDMAVTAQSTLQRFFGMDSGFTVALASNVTLGGGFFVDLVDKTIDLGAGLVGGK